MSSLWSSQELSEALAQEVPQEAIGGIEARGVSIDSRSLRAGDLFIAIRGENFDGADFIDEALQKQAAAVITESSRAGDKLIKVKDCQVALERLGSFARERAAAKVIAITGSVGKTAVKDGLAEVLSAHSAEKSFNNHWGVPLTLARLDPQEKFAVLEMGMNHKGEIKKLSCLARPDFVLITRIASAHIGFFNSLEEIAEAKAEIFDGLQKGGEVLLNRDCAFFDFLAERARQKVDKIYSFGAEGDGKIINWMPSESSNQGANVEADIFGVRVSFFQYIPSLWLAWNSVAVLTAAHILGQDVRASAERLSAMRPREGRGRRQEVKGAGIELIDESYNANPASMAAALESLRHLSSGGGQQRRPLVVLGDMAELGAGSADYHRALLEAVDKSAKLVFLCGEKMKYLYDILPEDKRGGYAPDASGLVEGLVSVLRKGDIILIKGSQKMRLSHFIEQLKERI